MEILRRSLCLLSGGDAGVGKKAGWFWARRFLRNQGMQGWGEGKGLFFYLQSRRPVPPEKSDNGVRLWGSPNPDTHTSRLTATLYVPEKRG